MEEIAILDIINRVEQEVKANFGQWQDVPWEADLPVGSKEIANRIDHTLLKPDATEDHILQLCKEAKEYQFASVCVNPTWVEICKNELLESPVKICTVAGFPLGATTPFAKLKEASHAAHDGADEIDMVVNVGRLKMGDYNYVYQDIKEVVDHSKKAHIKVILETCLLGPEQIVAGCVISKMAKANFVKTSTGFNGDGAQLENVHLMRRVVGFNMGVKAAGGIRDFKTAVAMIKAGASRIGASASVNIVTE
jgi:deoxyribose-phosphate aldolase